MDTLDLFRRSMSPLTELESESELDPVPMTKTTKMTRPRKRARTTATANDDESPAPPRRRRTQGKLSMFPAMPLDVLFEIFAHLPPGDLLSLARTSRALRALLLSRARAPLWRRAYAFVPPGDPPAAVAPSPSSSSSTSTSASPSTLPSTSTSTSASASTSTAPSTSTSLTTSLAAALRHPHTYPCPPAPRWMSEPAWAHLLFGGNFCHACGARPVRVHAGLLRRLCKACLSANLITRAEAHARFNFALDVLLNDMVSTIESKLGPHRTRTTTYWWLPDVERVHARVKAILEAEFSRRFADSGPAALTVGLDGRVTDETQDALDKLMVHVQARAAAHRKQAAKYAKWQRGVDNVRYEALHERKKSRREEISRRLLEEGFDKVDVLELSSHREVKADQQLTDRVWQRVHPILVTELARIKADRLAREAKQRASARRRTIGALYDRWLTTLAHDDMPVPAPAPADVYAFPPFAAFVETDAPDGAQFGDLGEVEGQLRAYVAECARKRYEDVCALRRRTIFNFAPAPSTPSSSSSLSSSPSSPSSSSSNTAHDARPPTIDNTLFGPATTVFRANFGEVFFGREALDHALARWDTRPAALTFDARARGAVALLLERLALESESDAHGSYSDVALDPRAATPADLDARDPALVCSSCPVMQRRLQPDVRGRVVFGWRDYATHYTAHTDTEPTWTLLTPTQAAACGFSTYTPPAANDDGWACARCAWSVGRIGSTEHRYPWLAHRWAVRSVVEKHLADIHDILSPVDGEDMIRHELVRHRVRARDSILWSPDAAQEQTGDVMPLAQPGAAPIAIAPFNFDAEIDLAEAESGEAAEADNSDGEGEGEDGAEGGDGDVGEGESGDGVEMDE